MKEYIKAAWDNRALLEQEIYKNNIRQLIAELDNGKLRIAENINGEWLINEWIKKGVILYFQIQKMETIELGPLEFHDKIPLKRKFAEQQVRVVPHAVVRYGAFLEPGVVLMPSYVNIGAFVGSGTMIDTWATVGSCAQIGSNVHISGGVGIGGVLEPVQAAPVIVEDDCFIGSRAIIVEGVHIKKGAVIAANVSLTQSTKIIDVTGNIPVEYKGVIPENAEVIPGTYPKEYPAGTFNVACALVIGKRKESTNKKTSLNEALRDFQVNA